jgi:Protein of unknown function (DUF3616)
MFETFFPRSRRSKQTGTLAVVVLASAASIAGPGIAVAQTKLEPAPTKWTLSENFKKSADARSNISGAACTTRMPPLNSCLVVNDEKKYAQFFSIEGTVIKPGKVIRLVDENAKGDPDAEGACYNKGYFYVTGSHGRSRHHPEKNSDPSYMVFRFPVDEVTGKPTFDVSEDKVSGVEMSRRLRDVIKDKVSAFYDQPLSENGVNIEGIAVKDGRMYLGLRGPSDNGEAFILSVDSEAVFTPDKSLNASSSQLHLGPYTGIRDLAAVSDGLLVLTGPVNEQAVAPTVRHWNPTTGALGPPKELNISGSPTGAKAETLLLLRDVDNEPWRALVMFDGPENGAPTEYLLPR